MLIRNKANFESSVYGINGKYIKIKPGQTAQVQDKDGEGYLRNYSHIFEKVESEGDASDKLVEENKLLREKNLLLERKVQDLSQEVIKLTNQGRNKTAPIEAQKPIAPVDTGLEELTKRYCEVTGKDKVPNNKKTDKQRIKNKIEEAEKLLSPKTNS